MHKKKQNGVKYITNKTDFKPKEKKLQQNKNKKKTKQQ